MPVCIELGDAFRYVLCSGSRPSFIFSVWRDSRNQSLAIICMYDNTMVSGANLRINIMAWGRQRGLSCVPLLLP